MNYKNDSKLCIIEHVPEFSNTLINVITDHEIYCREQRFSVEKNRGEQLQSTIVLK